MRRTITLGLVGAALVAALPADGAEKADPKDVAKATSAFAVDLHHKLKDTKGNLFYSPASLSTALTMTYAGAKGTTAEQMAKVLHLDGLGAGTHAGYGAWITRLNAGDAKRPYTLAVANALWGQKGYPWRDDFLKLTKQHYGAGLNEVDFVTDAEAARVAINKWVEDRTQKHIPELIKPNILTMYTRLVLTNAIYFQGNWAKQFDKNQTFKQSFFTGAAGKVETDMMHQTGDYRMSGDEAVQVLELPYAGGDLSMVIVLPKERDGLAELEKGLTADKLAGWVGKLSPQSGIRLSLPKFTTRSAFELNDVLKAMGMADAFDMNKADLTGLRTSPDKLYISRVIHQAFVDVSEEGTKAAAATAVIVDKAPSPPPQAFTADHPFLFLIRDVKTGGILFLGRLVDPTTK